jgi:type I pantothenate kinase
MNDHVLEAIAGRLGVQRPAVVGIAGAVAVGKTTLANALGEWLSRPGDRVEVVSTDAFLFPNEVLEARDLTMRKGFPESYVTEPMLTLIDRVRAGQAMSIPVYSHATYDIVPDETRAIEDVDVLVLEGVVALQSPVRERLDLAVYIDAAEDIVRGWFVDRFLRLTDEARVDTASFYHALTALGPDDVLAIARSAWDMINGVNLREHIAPTKDAADIVLRKGPDHAVVDVTGA